MQKNIVWTLVQGIVKIWGLATGLYGNGLTQGLRKTLTRVGDATGIPLDKCGNFFPPTMVAACQVKLVRILTYDRLLAKNYLQACGYLPSVFQAGNQFTSRELKHARF